MKKMKPRLMYAEVGVGVGFSLSVWSVFVIAWSIYFTFYALSYLFAYSRSGSAHRGWVPIIQVLTPEIKSVRVTTRATIKFYARRKRCARYLNVFHAFERSRQDARISNLLTLLGSIKGWSLCYHTRTNRAVSSYVKDREKMNEKPRCVQGCIA